MERAHPPRPGCLSARELSRYQIDIAALSETRLAEEGSIAEPKGYTFFWGEGGRQKTKTECMV